MYTSYRLKYQIMNFVWNFQCLSSFLRVMKWNLGWISYSGWAWPQLEACSDIFRKCHLRQLHDKIQLRQHKIIFDNIRFPLDIMNEYATISTDTEVLLLWCCADKSNLWKFLTISLSGLRSWRPQTADTPFLGLHSNLQERLVS